MQKIAIVGSKSLSRYQHVYEMIQEITERELSKDPETVILNGAEDGVDTMAGEIALSLGLEYEIVPLEKCKEDLCTKATKEKPYCFEHSFEPRSSEIARRADRIYRIFDQGCGQSTCEVTARFGDQMKKHVERIPVDLLAIAR